MHTRIQLDPRAEITIRSDQYDPDKIELVIADPDSECSTVIEMTPQQLDALCSPGNDLR